ncbi:U-box domain-containing protein 4 [Humulus lupulus]|uniref:U-box domain-containing protein 4 n=1 Tax=Humulus lupulus TaxID=3486 RepID=UPI002B4053E9|nr:U-box domain-containing protein 4 [Humulus lupulus]XP_062101870.1 U-box domain-containing protein 4 [Humulus lupulus]XP_062101871.1 U-box domain-containing protein 4 [Humulus lupulus]
MEISLLKALLNNISSFFHLSSRDNIHSEPILKYHQRAEEILKLLKTILDAIIDSEVTSNEILKKSFEDLNCLVDDLREQFENWQSLSSKVYFVLQIESIILKIRTSSLDIFQLLKSSHQGLPDELDSMSLEHCIQKIKHIGNEQMSKVFKEAIKDQVENGGPSSEILVKIAESLSLRSNQDILIEAVALEKLKENAEQSEKTDEVEFIDQMIALVTRMHERLITIKQSQSCSPVPIPPDFCCPLSLELMTDPVIVASGQTYERAFIKNWIDLGLTVCPKTRQTLAHTNLITNYTVKALIVNWCESNHVKLPDPVRSMGLNQPSHLLGHAESGSTKETPVFSHPRGNQPTSPELTRPVGSPSGNVSSSGIYNREGSSPLHPRSTSEGSLPSITGNGQVLDISRMSLTSSEDRSTNSEEKSPDSVGQPSTSPSRKEFSNSVGAGEPSQRHNRTVSASSTISNSNFSQERPGDASETLHDSTNMTGYSSDASGDVNREQQAAPQLPVRSRSQTIWRRPSERFAPRIVSSPVAETRADLSGLETQVRKLVEDLQGNSVDTQRDATAELRLLARNNMDNRIVIANCGAINLLVELLRSADAKIQENAVTALLNLSINDNNKTAIASANAIEPLIHVLETGSPEAKENSAATLFSLSVIEDNKVRIGRSGAIRPLVDLLGNGTPRGKKDAATALFNLSIFHENKARIVQAGAVKYLVELMDPAAGMVDKAVAVLANLATIPEGRTAIGQEGGIPVLVEVVELGSARGKENAAAALLQLCTNSGRYCNMVLQEGAVPPLVALSQSGTPRAKEKAQALLSYFRNNRHGNAGRG